MLACPNKRGPLTALGSTSIVNENPKRSLQAIDLNDTTSGRLAAMDNSDLRFLEARIDALIQAYDQLREENRALREQQTHLTTERAALLEKSELARTRVESMIARLRAMETGQ